MPPPTDAQLEWVARVLSFSPGSEARSSTDSRPQGAAVRLAQGMILWNTTRSHIGQQLKALQDAILAATTNEPDFDEIKTNIGSLEQILEVLDDRLSDKLNALRGTEDAQQKAKLSQEARAIVAEYQTYAAQDPLMNDIDDNGFVPLDIRARVSTTLVQVLAAI